VLVHNHYYDGMQ